jgi:hypothetical protein
MDFKSILETFILRDMENAPVTVNIEITLPEFRWKKVNLNIPAYLPASEYVSDDSYVPPFTCTENLDNTMPREVPVGHIAYSDSQQSSFTTEYNSAHFCLSKYTNTEDDQTKTKRNYVAVSNDQYANLHGLLESGTRDFIRTPTAYAVDVCSRQIDSPARDVDTGSLASLVEPNSQICTETYNATCKSTWFSERVIKYYYSEPDIFGYKRLLGVDFVQNGISNEAPNEACIATHGSGFNLLYQKSMWTTPGINITIYALNYNTDRPAVEEELKEPLTASSAYPAAFACPGSHPTPQPNYNIYHTNTDNVKFTLPELYWQLDICDTISPFTKYTTRAGERGVYSV